MKIDKKTKTKIFNFIRGYPNAFTNHEDGIIHFLNSIWDLRNLPSNDPRFRNALEDAQQHLVNNLDWDYEYTFLDRFDLLSTEEKFILFVEVVVSPEFRENDSEIFEFVQGINEYLTKEKFALVIEGFDDLDSPIHKLKFHEDYGEFPEGIMENPIKFYTTYETNLTKILTDINDEKFFILKFHYGWNDYSFQSTFHLNFFDLSKSAKPNYISKVKILSSDENKVVESIDDPNYRMTKLPESFFKLDSSFCTLGQEIGYYRNLKESTGPYYESVLFAFRDAAYDTDIQDEFENVSGFKSSLIRFDKAERVMREAKLEMEGTSREDLYKFTYNFRPKYADNTASISFEFNDDLDIPNRVCALIGKNGVGKTQILTSLPKNISLRSEEHFEPRIPLFSKVIAVSYSAFDSFEPPKKNKGLNYIFCGIRDENGEIINERSRSQKFVYTRKRIERLSRVQAWREVLYDFFNKESIDELFDENNLVETINIEKLNKYKKRLSSGENILFHSIADIVAHIRYDSLLLFDEPETHLHPNAITALMNAIYRIVNRFKSFCIIATHSPLIIRELLSRNVFVVEKENKHISIRKIGIESFGENLTKLTEEVFGNRDVPKQYRKIIERLLKNGKSVEDIIQSIESDGKPVSLNTRIFIESLAVNIND